MSQHIAVIHTCPFRRRVAKSLKKAGRTSQNLSISMSLPKLKEMLTKFKIMNKTIKHESTTKAIRIAGNVLNMNIVAINKISSKLKVQSFKIPHYA